MKIFFAITLLLISLLSYCQAPSIEWEKSLGGSAFDGDDHAPSGSVSICQTFDSGSIVTGITYSSNGNVKGYHGGSDIWVVKLNAKGKIEWQKCLGGAYSEWPRSIKQTFDKGYIIVGNTSSIDGDVSGNHGQSDAWVVKLDSVGNILWQRCLGGSAADYGTGIVQTKDSGYYVACITMSIDGDVSGIPGDGEDYWVIRLNKEGIIEWQNVLGGKKLDEPYNIDQTLMADVSL